GLSRSAVELYLLLFAATHGEGRAVRDEPPPDSYDARRWRRPYPFVILGRRRNGLRSRQFGRRPSRRRRIACHPKRKGEKLCWAPPPSPGPPRGASRTP